MKALNKTTLFLILTFAISFSLAGSFKLFGFDYTDTLAFTIMGAIYMFVPAIAVIIVKKFIHKEKLKTDLLISFKINRWFFVAWLLMPIIILCSVGVSLLFTGVTYSPEMLGLTERFASILPAEQLEQLQTAYSQLSTNAIWLLVLQALLAGITINAIAGFGEELAWRGFLLHQFKEMSFMKASVIIGFIWGIWHAPFILMGHNYPQHPQIGVLMMVAFCVLLTPIFMYLTIKSKSVIAASIAHGTNNAVAGISILIIVGGNDLIVGLGGLAGFITLSIFLIALFIYDVYISKDKILINKISNYL